MLSVTLAGLMLGVGLPSTGPVVVLDRSLRATTGQLVSLRSGEAVVQVAGKETRVQGVVAFVRAEAWGPDRAWPGLPAPASSSAEAGQAMSGGVGIELTDGTRLRGELISGKGDNLMLVSKTIGKVEFTLDTLRTLTIGDSQATPDRVKGTNDTVRLLNGDTVEGFVESIGPVSAAGGDSKIASGLAVTVERDKTKTVVPLERVSSVILRGGTQRKPPQMVWLARAECTGAAEFSIENGEARLARAKGVLAAHLSADTVMGAVIEPGVLTPLSDFPSKGAVEIGVEQALAARDLTIPEPGQSSWELPKGARRISGWAVLPEECRRWGDCTVTVTAREYGKAEGAKLAEITLNGGSPVAVIDFDLPVSAASQRLIVTIGEGRNGPVQDRVTLRRVLVVTGAPEKPPAIAP